MRKKTNKNRSVLIHAAMGKISCDLTIENVQYVNVFTGEIYKADVDILDGYVVRVRTEGECAQLPSAKVIDGENHFLIPGFIDAHMHVESSMMIPCNLSKAVVPWGTTTICTDPHEIANVLGIRGVQFMIENAKESSLRQYVLAPSCVPAVPGLEWSGAEFSEKEISRLLEMEDVIGIAELMDYVGVYNDCDRMHKIIDTGLEKQAFLQGHAPFVTGKELAAYRIGGPGSDHESETTEEIVEKLRVGMHINLRSSSLANHLTHLVEGIKKVPYHDHISICTDDVHANDLLHLGHVNKVVRYAIEAGLDPVDVVRMATLNAAREFGFDDLGAVAPGYIADMQLVRELDGRCPEKVFIQGKLVAENGKYLVNENNESVNYDNAVRVSWIKNENNFSLHTNYENETKVNVMIPLDKTNIIRRIEEQILPVRDGKVSIEDREDLAFVCVCNRHGKEQMAVAVIQDSGLTDGAYGTTVSHDSHNVVIVYKKEEDAFCVLKELERMGGGMCAARDGKVIGCMELPVAGLMSVKTCREVSEEFERYQKAFYEICHEDAPVMSASLMSLTALPGAILTDLGLVDGIRQSMVNILI